MKAGWIILLLGVGCQKGTDAGDEGLGASPPDCTLSPNYCVTFTSDWTDSDAELWCDDYNGSQSGDCPPSTVGDCDVGDGTVIHIYDMSAYEGAGYCEYLGGTWSEAGAAE